MQEDVKVALLMMYSGQIMNLVDNKDEMTHGDLEGGIEAVVLTLLNGNHNQMLEKILKMGA